MYDYPQINGVYFYENKKYRIVVVNLIDNVVTLKLEDIEQKNVYVEKTIDELKKDNSWFNAGYNGPFRLYVTSLEESSHKFRKFFLSDTGFLDKDEDERYRHISRDEFTINVSKYVLEEFRKLEKGANSDPETHRLFKEICDEDYDVLVFNFKEIS